MDPHIHSRNSPGMGIKKLLKKLVRVSEIPPKMSLAGSWLVLSPIIHPEGIIRNPLFF